MSGNPISRRDFLRLLGYGSVTLTLAPILKLGDLGRLKQFTSLTVSAQSAGSWVEGLHTTVVAIHAALLTSGKIFYLAGSSFHDATQNGPYQARIHQVGSVVLVLIRYEFFSEFVSY